MSFDGNLYGLSRRFISNKQVGTSVGAGGVAISTPSGVIAYTSGAPVIVATLDINLTTIGRPVYIQLMSDGDSAGNPYIGASGTAGNEVNVQFYFYRDGIQIANCVLQSTASATNGKFRVPPASFNFLDVVTGGTYNYQVFVSKNTGTSVDMENVVLVAYET